MTFDYVIIGGGHNGLIAATYLAKSGYSAVVIEQRPYLGGMAASYPHIRGAPNHLLSKGAIDTVFIKTTTIMDDLSLARHGLKLRDIDPSYGWINEDGETLCLFRSPEKTAADIARFSKADANSYLDLQSAFATMMRLQLPLFGKSVTDIGLRDLAKAALRLIGDSKTRKILTRLASSSAYEAIAATFESEPLRSLYAYWTEIACPPDVAGSGLYLASLSLIHQVGCSRPLGSMGGLIDALERALKSHGGTVQLNEAVEAIIVSGGRARGIRLRDGSEVLAAKGVIATCAPQVVYGRLLEKDHQTANSKARLPFIPANVSNMCPFKVDMAVGGPVGFTKAQQKRNQLDGVDIGAASMVTGTLEDHIQHAAALRAGTVGAKPAIWMTVLSHADNSIAPEGESVVYLYTSVPWEPDGGWPAQAQQFSDRLVGRAAQYLDGLSSEIGRHITTPLDFDQQYGTPRGCLYHVDMLPARLGSNRPAAGMGGSHTEISGLYLAGSGSHPSGGVFGMPGKLGAMQAIRDAK